MENYSHEAFYISGYKITTTNHGQQSQLDIAKALNKFKTENIMDAIKHKASDTLHVVYYNYTNPEDPTKRGYDVLIGFVTHEGTKQPSDQITSIKIPTQNYKYMIASGEMPTALWQQWSVINDMDNTELKRTFEFDMDMYLDEGVCVVISVK